MVNYSKIRWFLLIPVFGILIISYIVYFREGNSNKRYLSFCLWLGVSAALGVIVSVIVWAVSKAINGNISDTLTIIIVIIIFAFMQIETLIWCSVLAWKAKKEKQSNEVINN